MEERNSIWTKLVKTVGLQKLIAIIALIVIFAFFAISSESFRSFDTAVSILDASYYIGFLAIGVTFVIITGGIDLSIGTVMMCAAITGGVLHTKMGWPLWLALLAILVIGGVFGLFNGVLIAKFGLPPFIATLGTMMISRGLSSIVSNVQSITFPLRGTGEGWYKDLFRTQDNLPTGLVVLIVVALLAALVLNKTKVGRYIFAIGSNKEATRLSGVNVIKWEGIAYAATYSTILPGTGNGMELDAIAGVVVGGTSLAGGVGSVIGTIIGVFIMSVLKIGLPYIDLQPHYQLFITGFVVIVAVYSDILIRQNKKK